MAEKRYTFVIKKLVFAQKYDPGLSGVWRVADACEKKLKEIQSFIEKDMDPKERLQRKLMGKD